MQAAVGVKTMEKQLQPKKDFDPIMAGILEEVRHIILYTLKYHAPLFLGGPKLMGKIIIILVHRQLHIVSSLRLSI